MIATTIGKTFLKTYNQKFQTDYSAKTFFIEELVPLFFDYPKYMRTGGNAPLQNPKFKGGRRPDAEDRKQRIANTIKKIDTDPAGSSPIGYPSDNINATTSGQVSNLGRTVSSEEAYYSWIGAGFSIGVKGGLSFLFNEAEILLSLYEGWQYYRNYLEEIPNLAPNQIDTWNGQWLAHRYHHKYFNPSSPLANFDPFAPPKNGEVRLDTQVWTRVVFGLSQVFPNNTLLAYVFNLGQMNQTVGFIPIKMQRFTKPIRLYKKLFGENTYWEDADTIEQIYGNKNSLYQACERGVIGVRALEPKALRDLRKNSNKKIKYDSDDRTTVVSFRTYISWILAMLNNEQLHQLSKKIVQLFLTYESTSERGKMTKSRAIENLLKSRSPDGFLQELLGVAEEATAEEGAQLLALIEQVNKLRIDNFRRFLILLKLEYAIAKK
ncbi:MAG: hypothetical protein AAF990_20940 [Bacteroidota bacterium]